MVTQRPEQVPVEPVEAQDWTRQNLHVHVGASGEQYRFVMPGAALTEEEFRRLEEKVLAIESGSLLVVSGSLPPGIGVDNLTQLVKSAQRHGLRCIIDSSGEALAAALDVGNIELVKPNQKELSALVGRDLSQPDDVRRAAEELIRSGKVRRVVVSLGPQGALGVDASGSVQVVPPPMKSQRPCAWRKMPVWKIWSASASPPVAPPPLTRVPVCARWKTRTKSILTCAVASSPSLCWRRGSRQIIIMVYAENSMDYNRVKNEHRNCYPRRHG